MKRALALIDGEHYPPVVRFALGELARDYDVVAAVFLGGAEKIDLAQGLEAYGVPVATGLDTLATLRDALATHGADIVIDLSDEPVISSADRFEIASVVLAAGAQYRGADFVFDPPSTAGGAPATPATPVLAVIGTGKRVGKTAVSADIARRLKAAGRDVVVLAMGRGGPEAPEVIHGDRIALSTEDLLAAARAGKHASSDNYEDAVMSRVTTVGCRRCGGGMAGATFFGNVVQGAAIADALGKEILIAEGSGAAIPPVAFDAAVLVVGAGRGESYVRDYFGPYRVAQADLVVIAGAEEPVASAADVAAIRVAVAAQRPELPVVATTFRPQPVASVAGRRVFFATTAPVSILPRLAEHLTSEHGCEVVAASPNLSDRVRLREDMAAHAGEYDLLVTELKAAAIDVVAAAGEEAGVETVLCDNVPVAVDGADFGELVGDIAALAIGRGAARGEVLR